jgi:SAM-dependent methyltransferase
MSETNNRKLEHYEQIGVAMTCRSFEEYLLMFDLNPEMLEQGPILDVAAGASSFAAGAADQGFDVTAADPLYALSLEQIRDKGLGEIEESTGKLVKLQEKFDWSYYGSIQQHRAGREHALAHFIKHFSEMRPPQSESNTPNKYVPAFLPKLPFADGTFSLVLCSHFLFLYQEQFDSAFHEAALLELVRVCRPGGEVRVYPIMSLRWERYPELDALMLAFEDRGFACKLEQSRLPFIPGSTEMLVMRRPLTK